MGITNQAYIVAIGEKKSHVQYYLIVLDEITYRVDNVVKAVDIAFKIQFVLNSEYAKECNRLVWLFIQKYFFDINLSMDKKSTSASSLMRELL